MEKNRLFSNAENNRSFVSRLTSPDSRDRRHGFALYVISFINQLITTPDAHEKNVFRSAGSLFLMEFRIHYGKCYIADIGARQSVIGMRHYKGMK